MVPLSTTPKLLADNRDRFVGHPDRSRFLARHDTEADGAEGEKQALLVMDNHMSKLCLSCHDY